MTDTPREMILAGIRERLAKTTPMNYPLLKLSSAFADIEWLLAECDTLRAQLAGARADVVRMAASKIGDRCEHHTFALKVLESLTTRECPICWKACAEQVEAQLAAREGEIATLRIQYEQAEAEVLRHHEREDRLKEEALSWRRVSERLQGERLAAEARADTAEAHLRAQGWQPIETAHLDASALVSDGHYVETGYLWPGKQPVWTGDNDGTKLRPQPTHWMPIPAPPITKESQPHE